MNDGAFTIDPYHGVATWPWLAEVTRSSCCQLYALGGSGDGLRGPHHSNEIISEVRRRLGNVEHFSPHKEILRSIFGLLILLEDFAHIRRATYLPRETRILLFSPAYGRIAGGLPLESAEYDDRGVAVHDAETLGRIVTVRPVGSDLIPEMALAESYTWGSMTVPERASTLMARAGAEARPTAENMFFYNPLTPRTSFRGKRWQKAAIRSKFSVARREGSPPYAYFLIVDSDRQAGGKWYDISYEDAKRWLVVVDQIAGVTHAVRREQIDQDALIGLPMNLPDFCMEALASASNEVRQEGHLRYFRIPSSLSPLIDYVCKIAALNQYE